jgi:DNA-binding NtrC family response regulator
MREMTTPETEPPAAVLVAVADAAARKRIAALLGRTGYRCLVTGDGLEAYGLLQGERAEAAVLDLDLPRMGGLELLEGLAGSELLLPTVALVEPERVEPAVAAMKLGAFECLPKPPPAARLRALIAEALRLRQLSTTLQRAGPPLVFEGITGAGRRMRDLFTLIERVAPTDASVLIQGESGTGKELVARALHARSPRRGRRFFAINCAAVPKDLLESEFFGHERGAFTGALERRDGAFSLAHGGTLFLDEIDEMPVELQAKLLRVLEEKSFRRVGGRDEIKVDVRIVAATDKIAEELIRAGRFKEELFFRLNVVRLRLPPLRERPDDLPLLVRTFLGEFGAATGRRIRDLSPRAWQLVRAYPWPGNVRELRNALERAVIAAAGPVILPKDLPPRLRGSAPLPRMLSIPVGLSLDEAERAVILATLEHCQGNRSRAARLLRIGRRTLQKKLKARRS